MMQQLAAACQVRHGGNGGERSETAVILAGVHDSVDVGPSKMAGAPGSFPS
jgi:hypothetical protein